MPIIVTTKTFTDLLGTSRSYYKANPGDPQRYEIELRENIGVQTSATIVLNLDPVNNIFIWLGGSFEDEGFRVGDNIQCRGLCVQWFGNIELDNGRNRGKW